MLRALIITTVLAAAALLAPTGSANAAAKWCAVYDSGSTNCGFNTYKQCRADISGIGGFCRKNYYH